jgi:hypothetical protein
MAEQGSEEGEKAEVLGTSEETVHRIAKKKDVYVDQPWNTGWFLQSAKG